MYVGMYSHVQVLRNINNAISTLMQKTPRVLHRFWPSLYPLPPLLLQLPCEGGPRPLHLLLVFLGSLFLRLLQRLHRALREQYEQTLLDLQQC